MQVAGNRYEIPKFVHVLLSEAAYAYSTTPHMILDGSQEVNVCRARWEVIRALAADSRGWSNVQIGRWMRRHHTSIRNLRERETPPYPRARFWRRDKPKPVILPWDIDAQNAGDLLSGEWI